ncbi:Ig-like domain-containing protein [Myxococcota bacterium]|nr:Ig-like domain-containing protein [Myxococcota bacterium]
MNFRVERDALVAVEVRAKDAAGNERTALHRFRFGAPPPPPPPGGLQPSDPDDATPPRVSSIVPTDGAMVADLEAIVVRFSEAVAEDIETNGAVTIRSSALGSIVAGVELSADQLTARIDPGVLVADDEYTVTIGTAVRDLAGNPMASSTTVTFRTPPIAGGPLPDVAVPVATVMQGNVAYTLDRGTGQNDEGIWIHGVADPEQPVVLGRYLGLPDYPRALAIVPKWSYQQTLTAPAREDRTLLVAAGGLVGDGNAGQWIHVVDVTDPASPERVASLLAIPDFSSAIVLLRASAPRLFTLVNTGEGGVVQIIDLQSFIVGCNMSSQEFTDNPPRAGSDANGDGDFVDGGDTLPIPERSSLFGQEAAIAAPNRHAIGDFDVALGGSTLVSVMNASTDGFGSSFPARLQIHFADGLFVGDGGSADGAVEFPTEPRPFRVRIDPDLPVPDGSGGLRVVRAALVARGKRIEVWDITDPLAPARIADIGFGPALGPDARIFAIEPAGPDRWVVATDEKIFFLDRSRLTEAAASADDASPAVEDAIDLGTSGRSFAVSGSTLVAPGAKQIVQLAPRVSIVQVPGSAVTTADALRARSETAIREFLGGRVEEAFLLPAPLEATGGFAAALTDPPVPRLHHYALLEGSGASGSEVKLAIESLERDGTLLSAKGESFGAIFLSDNAASIRLEAPIHPAVTSLRAKRLSDDPLSPLYDLFLSDPFVIVREPLTAAQRQSLEGGSLPRAVVHAGEQMRVSIDFSPSVDGVDALEGKIESSSYEPGLSRTYTSLCSEYVDSPNPTFESGAPRLAGMTLPTGEYRHEATDLAVKGRSADLVMSRVYASRSAAAGVLGPGFDFNWNARICELPIGALPSGYRLPLTFYGDAGFDRIAQPGDALLSDGAGNVHLYRRIDEAHGNLAKKPLFETDPAIAAFGWSSKIASFYESPRDRFDALYRMSDGSFVHVASNGARTVYDADGRLTEIVPAFVDSRMRVFRRADGRLDRVEGDRGIALEFGWRLPTTSPSFDTTIDLPYSSAADLGRLGRVKAGARNVEYRYDDHGRLESVVQTHGRDMRYGWKPGDPLRLASHGHGSAGDEEPRAAITYDGALVDKVDVRGTGIDVGGAYLTAEAMFAANGGTATAVVGSAPEQQYAFDRFGGATDVGGETSTVDDGGRVRQLGSGGETVTLEYDDVNTAWRLRGNLLRSTVGSFVTELVYDGTAWNRLVRVTTPEGVTTTWSYAPASMLDVTGSSGLEIVATTGPVTNRSHFNRWGQFQASSLEESGATPLTRGVRLGGSNDLPETASWGGSYPSGAGGLVEVNIASDSNGVPSSFDSGGRNFAVQRDADGVATGFGDADLTVSTTTDDGRPAGMTVSTASGAVSQSLSYGADPFAVESMRDEATGLADVSTSFGYDGYGRVTSLSSNGETTSFGYTGAALTSRSGPGIEQSITFQNGAPTAIEDQGIGAALGYDGEGRLTSLTTDLGASTFRYGNGRQVVGKTVTDASFGTLVDETYGYDAAGRLESVTGALAQAFSYFPDGMVRRVQVNGQTVKQLTRDVAGRVTRIELPALGITTERTGFDGTTGRTLGETVTFPSGRSLTKTFDYANGALASIALPSGATTSFGRDDFGNGTATTDPDGVTTRATYAADGSVLSVTFGDGTGADYRYDGNRHLVGIGAMDFTLDAEKLVSVVTWPDGTDTKFRRTQNPLLVDEIEYGGATQFLTRVAGQTRILDVPNTGDRIEMQRDALGAVRKVTRGQHVIDVGLDGRGRAVSESTALGTWAVTIDDLGRTVDEDYPSGLALDYAVDGFGQPTQIGGVGISSLAFAAPGVVESLSYAGGVTFTRTLDADLRTTTMRWEASGAADPPPAAGFEYELTQGGRVLSEHRLHDGRVDVYRRNAPPAGMRIVDFELGALCRASSCGDATLDAGEACDDGNLFAGDGCRADCTAESCGDGRLDFAELCDDGNSLGGDGCRGDCTVERCGDGAFDAGEACDDGNAGVGDGCRADCTAESCGDGVLDPVESCDDGNGLGGDGCDASCGVEICGNGRLDTGEDCDDANGAYGDGCRPDCTAEACGDGTLDPGEGCDDGNPTPGDGCSPSCISDLCGNAATDPGESCDDGNSSGGDGCDRRCQVEACGNGFLDTGEDCDDGNVVNGDGCRSDCSVERCGDLVVDAGESCDDGNPAGGDGCRADCTVERCGDGLLDAGESCDDGNAADGDGCRADCSVERCGDAIPDAGEDCDDGNLTTGDGCRADCSAETCGDGALDSNEVCDDGNTSGGDACLPNCTEAACTNAQQTAQAPAVTLAGFDFDAESELLSPQSSSGAPDSRAVFADMTVVAGRLQQASGVTVLYDDGGSVSQAPLWVHLPGDPTLTQVTASFEHDGFGMLRRVTRTDGCEVSYVRDGMGRIVERRAAGPADRCRAGRQHFAWKDGRLIEEYEEVGPPLSPTRELTRRFVWVGSQLVLAQAAAAPGDPLEDFIPLAGINGSVGGYLGRDGALLESISYGPYGTPRVQRVVDGTLLRGESERSAIAHRLLFHAAFFDEATGLYQMGERTLHPQLGRFLERDAALYRDSRALLTAMNGDPVGNVDRKGSRVESVVTQAQQYGEMVEWRTAKEAGKGMVEGWQELREGLGERDDDWTNPIGLGKTSLEFVGKGLALAGSFGSEQERKQFQAEWIDKTEGLSKSVEAIHSVFEVEHEAGTLKKLLAAQELASQVGVVKWTVAKDGLTAFTESDAGSRRSRAVGTSIDPPAKAIEFACDADTPDSQRVKLTDARLAAAEAVLELAKWAAADAMEADKDAPDIDIDQMDKSAMAMNVDGLFGVSEALITAAKAVHEAQQVKALSEAGKIAFSAGEFGSLSSRVFPGSAALALTFDASFKGMQAVLLLVYDERQGNEYRRARRQFSEDGVMTVGSGLLSAAHDLTGVQLLQDAAWAIQRFHDYDPAGGPGPFAGRVRQDQQRMYLLERGLDAN